MNTPSQVRHYSTLLIKIIKKFKNQFNNVNMMDVGALCHRLMMVDKHEYDDSDLVKVLQDISQSKPYMQNAIITTSLKVNYTFDELLEYIRQQYFILQHEDEEGPYSGLGFGNECISMTTWDGWDENPTEVIDTDITPTTLPKSKVLRTAHLWEFIEFWKDYYNLGFSDFLDGLEVASE